MYSFVSSYNKTVPADLSVNDEQGGEENEENVKSDEREQGRGDALMIVAV